MLHEYFELIPFQNLGLDFFFFAIPGHSVPRQAPQERQPQIPLQYCSTSLQSRVDLPLVFPEHVVVSAGRSYRCR